MKTENKEKSKKNPKVEERLDKMEAQLESLQKCRPVVKVETSISDLRESADEEAEESSVNEGQEQLSLNDNQPKGDKIID